MSAHSIQCIGFQIITFHTLETGRQCPQLQDKQQHCSLCHTVTVRNNSETTAILCLDTQILIYYYWRIHWIPWQLQHYPHHAFSQSSWFFFTWPQAVSFSAQHARISNVIFRGSPFLSWVLILTPKPSVRSYLFHSIMPCGSLTYYLLNI